MNASAFVKSIILKLILSVIFGAYSLLSLAQDHEVKNMTTYPNPAIVVNWAYNSWIDIPENMSISPLSMGADIYGMYTLLGKNTFVSLAIGGGLSVQNIKSNAYYIDSDTSYFQELPKALNYSTNKISTVFLDVPIELRLRSRPHTPDRSGVIRKRNFRSALGFKIGYNIQNYIKYKGEDYRSHNYANQNKFKEYKLDNILDYRFGVYARAGFGKFSVYGYYALSSYFKKNKGQVLIPYSIGISINI